MNSKPLLVVAGVVAGAVLSSVITTSVIASAQQKGETVKIMSATPKPVAEKPAKKETVNVVRLSDTAFVVVKDHGDAATTMYFDTEAGFPVLKGGAKKYFYEK